MSESLQCVLVPLFSAGTSRRAVPKLWGTAFCIESDGYRFLATARHVLDDLHDGVFVRNGLDQIVPLDEFQCVDIPESDVVLIEIGFSQACKQFQPIILDAQQNRVPQSQQLLYLEGFPSSKNKLPHVKGLKAMGFQVHAIKRDEVNHSLRDKHGTRDCWFKLVRDNYTDEASADAYLPSLDSMSGSPVCRFTPVAGIAEPSQPEIVGVFVRAHDQEQLGAFALLRPALLSAIELLNHDRKSYLLRDIRRHRVAISEMLIEHNVTDLRVFGSASRYEDRPESDIDLVAKFDRGYDVLRDRVPLAQKLSKLINNKVDLIPEHELNPGMQQQVLREALPL